MNYVEMDPIIESIRNKIGHSDKILTILTDDNLDNLSYCKGIKKVNDREQFVKDINVLNVIEKEKWNEFKNSSQSELENNYIYVMNSLSKNDDIIEFSKKYPKLIFSETLKNVNFITPTPNAIVDTILYYFNKIDTKRRGEKDLRGVVITLANRSKLIGKPLAEKLIDLNATINWVHTKTDEDIMDKYFTDADCIVTAAGKPKTFLLTSCFGKKLIIDAGINVVDGKVCGDWRLDKLEAFDDKITITKNPGGIGKLTTYELFLSILKFI